MTTFVKTLAVQYVSIVEFYNMLSLVDSTIKINYITVDTNLDKSGVYVVCFTDPFSWSFHS